MTHRSIEDRMDFGTEIGRRSGSKCRFDNASDRDIAEIGHALVGRHIVVGFELRAVKKLASEPVELMRLLEFELGQSEEVLAAALPALKYPAGCVWVVEKLSLGQTELTFLLHPVSEFSSDSLDFSRLPKNRSRL